MKLFPSLSAFLFAGTLISGAALAQDNFQPLWETKLNHYDKDHAPLTTIVSTGADKKVAVLNPMAIEVFDSSKGNLITESACVKSERSSKGFKPTGFGSSKSQGIKIGAGKEKPTVADELDALQKIVHISLPHRNAVLRFDYGPQREVFSLIDLNNGESLWTNSELQWSMDRAKSLLSSLASVTPGPKARAALGVDMLHYPAHYVESLIKIIPERNELLVDCFLGLACVDLSTGETKWEVEQTAKGLSHMLYDEESNSLLTFGGNPAWLPTLPGLENAYQINKDILRIDMDSGDILWKSSYNKNYRVKKNGGFEAEEVKPDIRLDNGLILTNFNQIEVFDFETGQSLMETSTGKDASMGFMGYGPASEFALPVVEDNVLYRSVITSVMAVGASVGGGQPNNYKVTLEAYQVPSGELLWSSDEMARQKINNMAVSNGLLLLSFDGNEGVKALNPQTGEEMWSFETSKRGITTKWELNDNQLIVVEKDNIHFLHQTTGEVQQTIDAKKVTGNITGIYARDGKLLAVGEKKGVAYYNMQDASAMAQIKTGYKSEVHEYDDKVVLYPTDPSDPLMILDSNNMSVIGTVKKSGKRAAIHWCESTGTVYEVKGKKVCAQQLL